MNRKLLQILVCPKCKGEIVIDSEEDLIEAGEAKCVACESTYRITDGIPRFVPLDNYASSFGYQWTLFRKEQLDRYNGTTLSADRLWSETGWSTDELASKWILDAGCGAGRFLDAASESGGQIVGIDISSAIDAAKSNLIGSENVHFAQASIYELPFADATFDYCYCIGVIQHTPDTAASLKAIAAKVKPGGKFAVTIYPRRPWTKLFFKYWIRPATRRMEKERLLRLIEKLMPIAFPITNFLFRIPVIGKFFSFVVPVANYINDTQLSREQRYAWAVLDTFDMLSPYYDQPMTEAEAREALKDTGIQLERTQHNGLNLVGVKRLI